MSPIYGPPHLPSKNARKRDRLAAFQNHRCFLCGKPLGAYGEGANEPTFHHFIPIGAGGPVRNLAFQVIAHGRCNSREGAQKPSLWQWVRYVLLMGRRGYVRCSPHNPLWWILAARVDRQARLRKLWLLVRFGQAGKPGRRFRGKRGAVGRARRLVTSTT